MPVSARTQEHTWAVPSNLVPFSASVRSSRDMPPWVSRTAGSCTAVVSKARIVVEAKEDASYNLKKALDELEDARKNRGADIGVFVFSKRTAPNGLEVFNRYGNDVVVIWDAEDTGSDVFLDAGLSVARALCARPKSISAEVDADF